MNLYLLVINAEPNKTSAEYIYCQKAIVHSLVMEDSLEEAQQKALGDIKSKDWTPGTIEVAQEITYEQIQAMEPDISIYHLYERALKYGIASDYIASQRKDVPLGH